MKLDLQYVNDSDGNTHAVQVSIDDWNKVMGKLEKYERTLKVKADLEEAFAQVKQLQKKGAKKKTLSAFLNEL